MDAPLDHGHVSAGSRPLRVARHRAKRFPTGQAIFQLAGGPGGSSVAQSGIIPKIFSSLRDDFDFVYVDQRGTGGSGYLDCPGGYPETESAWQKCASALSDLPLEHYGTLAAAHDLDLVRERLGYPKIHLRAGSYGTRLALELLRQHPDGVASAVLDGLVPPDIDFLGELARAFDRGVTWLITDCMADPACLEVAPTLAADLWSYRASLAETPRPILVGGSPTYEDEALFLAMLEASLYERSWRFRVPRAMHQAAAGDYGPWNALLGEGIGAEVEDGDAGSAKANAAGGAGSSGVGPSTLGTSYVAPGLWLAIVCSEEYPDSGGVAAVEALTAEQLWPADRAAIYARVCDAWGLPAIAPELREPVEASTPVLLLSGELDLRTPPAWGAQVASPLQNARHVVVPYAFHSTMGEPCVTDMISAFFRSGGDLEQLDSSCIESIAPPAW